MSDLSKVSFAEGGMTLHYGIHNSKLVLMVTDQTGIVSRISMTRDEWEKIKREADDMAEGEVRAIQNHAQVR